MTTKQKFEIALAELLLSTLGFDAAGLQPGDKPDVEFTFDGRWIGLEVTELHPGAGATGGSATRADEERAKREHRVAFHWASTDHAGALEQRIREKVDAAIGYRCEPGGALWLLISAQIPA